jgi:hypothetical protein
MNHVVDFSCIITLCLLLWLCFHQILTKFQFRKFDFWHIQRRFLVKKTIDPNLLDFERIFFSKLSDIYLFIYFSLSYLPYNQILLNFLLAIQHFGHNTKLRKPKKKKGSSSPLISTLLRVFSLNVLRKLKCQIQAMDLNFRYLDCVIQKSWAKLAQECKWFFFFFLGSTRIPILQHINDKHVDHEYNLPFSNGFEVIINKPT